MRNFIPAPCRAWCFAAAMALPLLAGCDIPGLSPDPRAAAKEEDAKAIGGACRLAMRGLEDCFTLNPKASKGQIFAGWKDMDAYMRENKIEGSPSVLSKAEDKPPAKPARKQPADGGDEGRSRS